jgi:hypothetical protein
MRRGPRWPTWCASTRRAPTGSWRSCLEVSRPASVPNRTRRFARWLAERDEVGERLGELGQRLGLR